MNKEFLTPKEAAQFLGYTPGTLYVKCNRKEIPYIKQGKFLRFEADRLKEFVISGRVEPKSK